ncbi:MAG: hypothetical protein K6G50_10985 [bacterium]|nr:hypothetical protein [bacterium]
MFKLLYSAGMALALGGILAMHFFAFYPFSTTDNMAHVDKNIRNNPSAFRSFHSTHFTGK